MTSPIVPKNDGYMAMMGNGLHPGPSMTTAVIGGTVEQKERRHFVRRRVNTRTPNRKSNAVVISTATMQWDLARELIDTVG